LLDAVDIFDTYYCAQIRAVVQSERGPTGLPTDGW
jgi:hypothetical protein